MSWQAIFMRAMLIAATATLLLFGIKTAWSVWKSRKEIKEIKKIYENG